MSGGDVMSQMSHTNEMIRDWMIEWLEKRGYMVTPPNSEPVTIRCHSCGRLFEFREGLSIICDHCERMRHR